MLASLMARGDAAAARTRAFVLALTGDANGAKSAIEGSGSSWHIFEKQSKRGDSREYMLIWKDRVILEQSSESREKKKVHRSREAAWADVRGRINKKLKAEYLPAIPISHSPPAIVVAKNVSGLVASPLTDERFDTVSIG